MEADTPVGGSGPGVYGTGGNGNVTVWALDNTDKDDPMRQMTDLLVANLDDRLAARVPSGKNIANSGKKLGNSDSLCITGHSSFKDSHDRVKAPGDRELGGFNVGAVADELVQAVRSSDTLKYIEFWCCESACSQSTAKLDGGADKAAMVDFDLSTYDKALACKSDALLSTLDVICLRLVPVLLKSSRNDVLVLTGLNGVGFIQSGEKQITTFDRSQISDLNKIRDAESLEKHGKKLNKQQQTDYERAAKRFDDHRQARQCNYIVNKIDIGKLKADYEKQQAARKLEPAEAKAGKPGKGGRAK